MSSRREREILRQLSARRSERREVEPPADLLERIRAEIPTEVRVHRDATARGSGSGPTARQRWLIAASLAAMVGMGLFALHVRESEREEKVAAGPIQGEAPPEVLPAPASPPAAAPPAAVPAPAAPRRKLAAPAPAPVKPQLEESADAEGTAGGALGRVQPKSVPPAASARRAPPPATAPAPPVPPVEAQTAEGGVAGGVPGGVVGGAPEDTAGRADSVAAEAPPLSRERAEPSEPRRMAKAAQPDQAETRSRELAQGGPAPLAEGAPAPLADGQPRWLLRFRPESAPLPPGARPEVAFDPAAVARSRRVGGGADLLYEVELRPGTTAGTTVATLRGIAPGAPPLTLRILRVADLTPAWEQTSPGFRLASLAAELEEVLAGTRPRSALPELLRRARELAGELPGDPRATDLLRRIEQAGRP